MVSTRALIIEKRVLSSFAQRGTRPQRSSSMRLPSRSSTTASTSCVGAMLKRSNPLFEGGASSPSVSSSFAWISSDLRVVRV
jgi:hypothetical protein